jgi:hypothetical protein
MQAQRSWGSVLGRVLLIAFIAAIAIAGLAALAVIVLFFVAMNNFGSNK